MAESAALQPTNDHSDEVSTISNGIEDGRRRRSRPPLSYDHLPSVYAHDCDDPRWVPRDDPFPPSPFPAPTHYKAKDTLNAFYAAQHLGFAVNIDKPTYHKPSKTNPHKYVIGCTLRCSSGRAYRHTSNGIRSRTSTHMTGCEWRGRLRARNDPQGTPMWTFTVDVPHHNHDRVVSGNALFHHRGRRPDTPARIADMWRQHAPASSITESLLLDGENISISDVRNEIARLRREELSGRTMIEAFVHHLEHFSSDESGDPETKYWCKIQYSSDGHVQNVFFAHPCFTLKITSLKGHPVERVLVFNFFAFDWYFRNRSQW